MNGSHRFGMTWLTDDRVLILGWTIRLGTKCHERRKLPCNINYITKLQHLLAPHSHTALCIFRNKPFQTKGCKCTGVEDCLQLRADWVAAQPAVGGQSITAQLVYFSVCAQSVKVTAGGASVWIDSSWWWVTANTSGKDVPFPLHKPLINALDKRSALQSAFCLKCELKANITYESVWNCATTKHKTNQVVDKEDRTDKNNVPESWTNIVNFLKVNYTTLAALRKKKTWIMTQFHIQYTHAHFNIKCESYLLKACWIQLSFINHFYCHLRRKSVWKLLKWD